MKLIMKYQKKDIYLYKKDKKLSMNLDNNLIVNNIIMEYHKIANLIDGASNQPLNLQQKIELK